MLHIIKNKKGKKNGAWGSDDADILFTNRDLIHGSHVKDTHEFS